MKKVKSFEAACKVLGTDPDKLPKTTGLGKDDANYLVASFKLNKIRKAIVGKWKADYSNPNQRKWYVVFIFDPVSGAFRFNYADYALTCAYAGCGARHVFETEEQAIYFGENFLDLHNVCLLEE